MIFLKSLVALAFVVLVVLVLIVGSQGQTFQYSRGWTNGKRSQIAATREAACQLYRLRALIEAKPIPQAYYWCDLPGYVDNGRLLPPQPEIEEQQSL